ncbi:hypothetical protein HY384_01720 [Candidatus Daviesbacteria bacterium]|nr:hypothetical protein [Candidatus Daviesbacteria bacterium]
MENLGILAALGAALFWGSYVVPFKKSQTTNLQQFQFFMGLGIFLSGLFFSVLLGYSLNLNKFGLISGILWAIANAISLVAVANLGMSKAIPLISSLVILSSFLWGALVFGELPGGLFLGFLAVGLIVAGVAIVGSTGNTSSQNIKKGLVLAVISGLIFGSQLVPLKIGTVSTQEFFFSLCLGIFFASLIIALVLKTRFNKEGIVWSLLSGIIWNIGGLLSLISISKIGLAKGMPISQLAILVAVLWGLFFFKEVTGSKKRLQILAGAIILLIGVIILGFA